MEAKKLKQFFFSKTRMIFYEFLLDSLTGRQETPPGIRFSRFALSDIDLLEKTVAQMEFESMFTLKDVKPRMDAGNILYEARKEGEIIGYFWVDFGECHIHNLGVLSLASDELYCNNAYIRNDYRGRGLYNLLRVFALRELKNEGYRRAVGCYYSWNHAARRMNKKLGVDLIGTATFGYIAGVRYCLNTVKTNEIAFQEGPSALWRKLLIRVGNLITPAILTTDCIADEYVSELPSWTEFVSELPSWTALLS